MAADEAREALRNLCEEPVQAAAHAGYYGFDHGNELDELVDAIIANRDVVLRALGAQTLMSEHGGISFRRIVRADDYVRIPEVPGDCQLWVIPNG